MIKIIVAMDQNNLIGSQDGRMGMPWFNPEDLAHFKQTTLNQTILMGRKTYEAIGKVLPDRTTLVVSHHEINDSDVQVISNLEGILQRYKNIKEDIYICGGASIYEQCLRWADELIISLIPGVYQGDAYFTKIDMNQFKCVETKEMETFILKRYRRMN